MSRKVRKGSYVRVDPLANLPQEQIAYRGRIGFVTADSEPGTNVIVTFRDHNEDQTFSREVLTLELSADDPAYKGNRGKRQSLNVQMMWAVPRKEKNSSLRSCKL